MTSLYQRYAQGAPVKGNFKLSTDNIDQYHHDSLQLNQEVRRVNAICDLKYKLSHMDEVDDELYTKEYLERRLSKLTAEVGSASADAEQEIYDIKEQMFNLKKELDKVRPLVFDKVEGQKPENHERMSQLDDQRKSLEDQLDSYYGRRYPALKEHLPKVYYMIVDGVDIDMITGCFKQMTAVLREEKSSDDAVGELMDESTAKYNLPVGIWDPIRPVKQKQKRKTGRK